MTANIRNISIAVFFLVASIALVIAIHNGRILAHSLEHTAGNLDDMSGQAKEAFRSYREQASSPKNQASLDAAIQLGAVWNATGREMNTQVLPRFWKLLDTTRETTAKVGTVADQTRETVKAGGDSTNAVLASLRATLDSLHVASDKLGVDLGTLGDAVRDMSQSSGLAISEVTRRIADPRFDLILDSATEGIQHLNGTAIEIEKASKALPEIAAALEKISTTTSRFTKAYWVARILSIVVPLVP